MKTTTTTTPDPADDIDMQLLVIAMTTTREQDNPHYTLPEPVMRRYARFIREDERARCADDVMRLSADQDSAHRERMRKLAADLIKTG